MKSSAAAIEQTPAKSEDGYEAPFAPSEPHDLAVRGQYKGIDLRASGLYAAACLGAASVTGLLLWADPLHNAQHFLLCMLACVASGALFSAVMAHGRLQDALGTKNDFRHEMNRMADRNQDLERRILRNRLSSAGPTLEDKSYGKLTQNEKSSRPIGDKPRGGKR